MPANKLHIQRLFFVAAVIGASGCSDPVFQDTSWTDSRALYVDDVFKGSPAATIAKLVDRQQYGRLEKAVTNLTAVNGQGMFNVNPLWLAVKRQDKRSVEILLKAGAKIDIELNGVRSSMYMAAEGDVGILQLLIQYGGDVNRLSCSGSEGASNAPLNIAVSGGHRDNFDILLAAGADVNARDQYQGTVLMSCTSGAAWDIMLYLLEKGADPRLKDKYGMTFVDWMERINYDAEGQRMVPVVLDWLVKHGYDLESLRKNPSTTNTTPAVPIVPWRPSS